MIFDKEFDSTRQSYQSRNLGYSQLKPGELKLLNGLRPWVFVLSDLIARAIKINSGQVNVRAKPDSANSMTCLTRG